MSFQAGGNSEIITNLGIDAVSYELKAHVDDGFPGLMFGGGA